ncbi:hypothetical protein K435DRAFT_352691 [Dendrothele bispora CBS 962.96]|uniref:Uncharacterized protein n=1 Tax=Dendrothele bispora (strain CBS 962.96) TaxID=1314807 RepID=A0A4S8MI65_DENBC|nr:hypothetical protein K435DRAFT_352691 [Dendrothele bispora CBS 962.96]
MVCTTTHLWVVADAVVGRHPHAQPLHTRPFVHSRVCYPWRPEQPGRLFYPAILNPDFLKPFTSISSDSDGETRSRSSSNASTTMARTDNKLFIPKSPGSLWSDTSTLLNANSESGNQFSPEIAANDKCSATSTIFTNQDSNLLSPTAPVFSRHSDTSSPIVDDKSNVLVPSSRNNTPYTSASPISLKTHGPERAASASHPWILTDSVSRPTPPSSFVQNASKLTITLAPPIEPLPPVPVAALRLRAKAGRKRPARTGTYPTSTDKENYNGMF